MLGIFHFAGGLRQPADLDFPALQVRADLFADESADEPFQFHGRFVVSASFGTAVAIRLAHRAKALEHAQSLAGGAFADIEPLDQVIQRQR